MNHRFLMAFVGALALPLLLMTACGGGGGSGGTTPEPTATVVAAATATPGLSEVDVRLYEWSLDPSAESVPAGTVGFKARNIGGANHEMVVVRTDLAPDALPTLDDGSVDESAVDVVGELSDIGPGLSKSGSLDLPPGNYVLICNLVDDTASGPRAHYAQGMYAGFKVTE